MAKTVAFLDNRYEVYILPEARAKMELYCDLSSEEIGWLAFVERTDVGFLITDCILLKQEVHATTTEIDPTALLEFWNNTPVEKQANIKLWGHSHVNMAASPSGQDDSQMDYFKSGNDWFIRLITNKRREYHIDVFDYKNGIKVHMDQADLKTYNPSQEALKVAIEAEIKEKVSHKSYTAVTKTDTKKYLPYTNTKKEKAKAKKDTLPILEGIEVKYVSSFDEVLNDPNYWQDISV